jgi:hypothetical protein
MVLVVLLGLEVEAQWETVESSTVVMHLIGGVCFRRCVILMSISTQLQLLWLIRHIRNQDWYTQTAIMYAKKKS